MGHKMREEKQNLKKLKILCDTLVDRDKELKLNSSTLWMVIEKLEAIKSMALSRAAVSDNKDLEELASQLGQLTSMVMEKGCKKEFHCG